MLHQQCLLVGNLHLDIGGYRISQPRRVLDLAQLHGGLGGQLAVELGIAFELIDDRAHECRHLGVGRLCIGVARPLALARTAQQLNLSAQMPIARAQFGKAGALLAFHQYAHRPIGQLEQLQHTGSYADVVKVFAVRVILRRIKLRD